MKSLLFLLFTITVLTANAQKIQGYAHDENGQPLSGATISLLQLKDSIVLKLAVTTKDGVYSFTDIKEGNYLLKTSHTGYKPAFSQISLAGTDVTVPGFKLTRLPASLANVTVTAQKPIMEVKADKIILNVEGTINATGSTALELLRKSPGVVLDKEDNISLAGKNGVQVYIDGRPTPLSGAELAQQLRSLQSAQIEAIELITNPSVKYDAAGNAGIINIRLKRNKSLGTNGSVNAGWNIGKTAKYTSGFSLNYRNKSFNLFSTYGFNKSPNLSQMNVYRTVGDSLFDGRGYMNDYRTSHNFKAGADYFISKTNTVGITVNGIISDPISKNGNQTAIGDTKGTTDRILVADNTNTLQRKNTTVNLNYSYASPKGRSLIINADRGGYTFNSDQLQANYYYNPSGQTEVGRVINHMVSAAKINIHAVKGDYEQNLGKGKISFGAKTAWVKTDNDFLRSDIDGVTETIDRERSNHFTYREQINAGYLQYNRQYKGFMVQGGLRVEHTITEGKSDSEQNTSSGYKPNTSSFNRNYTDLFPSAAITFNKNLLKTWTLNFNRRIDRPGYTDLNPFEFKLDEYTYMKGNTNLRPQYTTSFGIAHSYKYKLNLALNYSHVQDLFTQMFDTTEGSKAFVSKRNLATQDVLNLTISYPFQYKAYSLFTNITTNYSLYKADFGSGRKVDQGAIGFNLFLQNSLKLKKTWTAELSGFYNAPTIMGTFQTKGMYSIDAGVSKQLMKGKATMKASVSDLFNTLQFRATSDFAGQLMRFSFKGETRQAKLSLVYRFGNSGVKPARQRSGSAEEELKRTQAGGGILGN